MHELAITQSIIEICEQHAAGKRVLAVVLEIGELSGVVPESVEFCFEACGKETSLCGARLVIDRPPGRGRCRGCGAAFPIAALYDPCPNCNGYGIEIVAGQELRVKELEVE